VTELKAIRDQARADAERAAGALERAGPSITPQALKTFASQARRRMRIEGGGYRRDHCARWLSASKWTQKKFASWDRKANCCVRRRRIERKICCVWSAQFCTEVARPTRFERVTFAFGAI